MCDSNWQGSVNGSTSKVIYHPVVYGVNTMQYCPACIFEAMSVVPISRNVYRNLNNHLKLFENKEYSSVIGGT